MGTQVSYCGIECNTCPIHLATLEQDKSRRQILRESIARQCSELYGMDMKLEDITDCDGCKADTGQLFSGCLNCKIRKCAGQKNIETCAFCEKYLCKTLGEHFLLNPDVRTRLEEIRQNSL